MATRMAIPRITGSIFKHLSDGFSGEIHWPGTEGADDNAWIEPWADVELVRARTNDWLYRVRLTVNIFVKKSDDTYMIFRLTGEIVKLLKAIKVLVKDYENPGPVTKGCVSFKEPEAINLGERQERSVGTAGHTGIQQMLVRCDGIAYPLAL